MIHSRTLADMLVPRNLHAMSNSLSRTSDTFTVSIGLSSLNLAISRFPFPLKIDKLAASRTLVAHLRMRSRRNHTPEWSGHQPRCRLLVSAGHQPPPHPDGVQECIRVARQPNMSFGIVNPIGRHNAHPEVEAASQGKCFDIESPPVYSGYGKDPGRRAIRKCLESALRVPYAGSSQCLSDQVRPVSQNSFEGRLGNSLAGARRILGISRTYDHVIAGVEHRLHLCRSGRCRLNCRR